MPHRRYAASGPRLHDEDAAPVRRELLWGIGIVVMLAFGAFVWNAYDTGAPPRITPTTPAYKIAPPPDLTAPDPAEAEALEDVLQGRTPEAGPVHVRPGPETPITAQPPPATPPGAMPQLAAAPRFVANGPYVAQIAALQSQEAVEFAWARLSSRAPALFEQAQLDVERADLGQRGVYYRVRAGYFADRENTTLFCDRIKAMGQDCIAVRR